MLSLLKHLGSEFAVAQRVKVEDAFWPWATRR
jgi:hypothetical protein